MACKYARRHLLLGNGFSISKFPAIFSYKALFDQADLSDMPHVREVFDSKGTQDFEAAIHALNDAANLAKLSGHPNTSLAEEADKLKNLLLSTIAKRHPERPNEIKTEEYAKCRQFLATFLSPTDDAHQAGRVYTLNYDLLLYWTLMHADEEPGGSSLDSNDGFGLDASRSTKDVVWNGYKQGPFQRVFFLHGALHLFDTGTEITKNTWKKTRQGLIDQTRTALKSQLYPLFVAEGDSESKLKNIKHNSYLSAAFDQFRRDVELKPAADSAWFVFGHSLNDTDLHYLRPLFCGKNPRLFIGVFGDPAPVWEKVKRLAALQAAESRPKITLYDAGTANVWN
jgi:hypothetical protein